MSLILPDHPPAALGTKVDKNTRKVGDWWILGSTNFTVVEPKKSSNFGKSVQNYPNPKSSRGETLKPAVSISPSVGVRVVSRLFTTSGQPAFNGLRSSRYGNGATKRNDSLFSFQSAFPQEKRSVVLGPASKGRNSPETGNPSAFHRGLASQRHMQSFRGIFQKMRTDALRSFATGLGSSKPSSKQPPSGGGAPEAGARGFDYDSTVDGKMQDDNLHKDPTRASPRKDTPAARFRDMARERLKRNVMGLTIPMDHVSYARNGDRLDTDTRPGEYRFVDTSRKTMQVLGQLAQNAQLVVSQMRTMQRASEGLEGLATLAVDRHQSTRPNILGAIYQSDTWGFLGRYSSDRPSLMTDIQQQGSKQAADSFHQMRQKQIHYLSRLLEQVKEASELRELRVKGGEPEVCMVLTNFEELMDTWRKGGSPLIVAVAIASLVCAMAYFFCGIGCTEMAAQTFSSTLVRYGMGEPKDESVERFLRYCVLNESLTQHRRTIDDAVVHIISLALIHDSLTSGQPASASITEAPTLDHLGTTRSHRTEEGSSGPDHPVSAVRSEIFALLEVAQHTILEFHEAGGRRDEPVFLEREAARHRHTTVLRSPKVVMQKLAFATLELRVHMSKLLAIRLSLSELGCMQIAWNEINGFKTRATVFLRELESDV